VAKLQEAVKVPLRKGARMDGYKLFLFALPGILLVYLFHYAPLWGWSFSLFQYRPGRSLAQSAFVGLNNFKQLFGNPVLRMNLLRVLRNTIGIHFLGYCFSLLPMLLAVFLSEMRSKRFQRLVQSITTLPHFISWVIMFSLASSFLGPSGLINTLLKEAGAEGAINILNSPNNVWITQVMLQLWKDLGWNAIVYFAALSGLDQEVYEAARVDGADRGAVIWYITLPLLLPTYFVLMVISIGNFLNMGIDQYLAFGNALNKEYIEILDLYVYNLGIGGGQISYSVAVGIMKSVVAIILFSTANLASKKIRGESVF
jgi:putative aldouronate transport system permease protein